MKRYEVTFNYYSGGESAADTFVFSNEQAARDKVAELRAVIEDNFAGCRDAERVDEPGFFGLRDPHDGAFARVMWDY